MQASLSRRWRGVCTTPPAGSPGGRASEQPHTHTLSNNNNTNEICNPPHYTCSHQCPPALGKSSACALDGLREPPQFPPLTRRRPKLPRGLGALAVPWELAVPELAVPELAVPWDRSSGSRGPAVPLASRGPAVPTARLGRVTQQLPTQLQLTTWLWHKIQKVSVGPR